MNAFEDTGVWWFSLVIKNWNHLMKDLENIYKLKELIPA